MEVQIKRLTEELREAEEDTFEAGAVSDYVMEHIFEPLLRDEQLFFKDMDFSRFSQEDIRDLYNIPTPLEAKDDAGNVIGHYGDFTPDDEGYTTLMVKAKYDNSFNYSSSVPSYDALIDAISKNVEEVRLLTEGEYYAKGNGIVKPGALFKTSGAVSSFYFISKGQPRRDKGDDSETRYPASTSYLRGSHEEIKGTIAKHGRSLLFLECLKNTALSTSAMAPKLPTFGLH